MRPTLDSYTHLTAGKVRELYTIDQEHLLLVASDRISAFDHVLSSPIPDKGAVLTAMSVFWFSLLGGANQLAGPVDDERIPAELLGRALVVKKLNMVPVECVARGYLTGSGLLDYQRTGSVCGIKLDAGLVESSKLSRQIFTPATKAELGEHDENVDFDSVVSVVGQSTATALRTKTLDIYSRAAEFALSQGIILADTKFEFGTDKNGELVLADEVLTPDSSRFWPADGYQEGSVQPSFDKQFVRNWLISKESGWDRSSDAPPPPLPEKVITQTRLRYIEAYERLTGLKFADWIGVK
ncbi:MAG: phosphoribosylaminoimidazolesuccinocarboxamide synthase [Mycobacteriaceae bacterium]